MDLNKAMEELEEIKSSESFEEYLSNNREEIYKLLKAKSEELIESGVSDIKDGVMDYFIVFMTEAVILILGKVKNQHNDKIIKK